MEIVNFFEKLTGRWFSQRTTHDLATHQSKAGKSDLDIRLLDPSDIAIQQLCDSLSIDPTSALCGLKVTQKSTIEGNSKQQIGSTLLVPLASTDNEIKGQLIRHAVGVPPIQSQYSLDNEVLTISSQGNDIHTQERWWFITDNLRMRTNVLKHKDGFELASFCSEIKLGDSATSNR